LEELVSHASRADGPDLLKGDLGILLKWMGIDHAGQIGSPRISSARPWR